MADKRPDTIGQGDEQAGRDYDAGDPKVPSVSGQSTSSSHRIVGNEYRTGVHKPAWWDEAAQGDSTVFVPQGAQSRVKDAALREYARRDKKRLHTRRDTIDGESGTVYWFTDKS